MTNNCTKGASPFRTIPVPVRNAHAQQLLIEIQHLTMREHTACAMTGLSFRAKKPRSRRKYRVAATKCSVVLKPLSGKLFSHQLFSVVSRLSHIIMERKNKDFRRIFLTFYCSLHHITPTFYLGLLSLIERL